MPTLRERIQSLPIKLSELGLVLLAILPLGWVVLWSYETCNEPERSACAERSGAARA